MQAMACAVLMESPCRNRLCTYFYRPANLENVFRGTFRVKKAGLAGKKRDGWQGPHSDIFRSRA